MRELPRSPNAAAARAAGFEPVGDVAHALLADAVASSVAHWSAQAVRLGEELAGLPRYEPPGSRPDLDARAAVLRRGIAECERHRDALQAHLARLEGSDWPAAELVDGITDDVPAGGEASPLAHGSPDERRDAA
jgi:hypothetical protein